MMNPISRFDESVLMAVGNLRSASLNGPMVNVTALGSTTVAVLIGLAALIVLWLVNDRLGIVFLLLSLSGAGLWSYLIKLWIRRDRPTLLPHLVEVTDFSYPSGHTMLSTATFLTLALLAARHLRGWGARVIFFLMASLLIALVGFSRVYLGVHYPSDVLSGAFLGAAWTFGLAAAFFQPKPGTRSASSHPKS
ncbi:MAG TPA: phosphatase PAP2 family protein [bacterium]|nr:phosphatase PAP2 family protein [bacterium]